MQQIRDKCSELTISREHQETKEKLRNLQKKHDRLKRYNKLKRMRIAFKEGVVSEQDAMTIIQLQDNCKQKDDCQLQYEKTCLEDTFNDEQPQSASKKEGKRYPTDMRMSVYEAVVNNVPTKNIPNMISGMAKRMGVTNSDVPQRSTIEMMCRELGAIADFQAAEYMLQQKNMTVGFDATTQEGVHINSVHVTSPDECHIIAVDPLAGGKAEDYEVHINQSIDNLAEVDCAVHEADKFKDNPKADFPTVRSEIIASVSNSMTDRAAVNHATVTRLENSWGKKINELNCHLHPLEAIASECRKALQRKERPYVIRKLLGSECLASGLVLSFNKFRYKYASGDPKGFILALVVAKLPRGLLPRYRGNRIHVMFLICARLFEHQEFFRKFLRGRTFSCNRLKTALQHDFDNPVALVEIQVLGLLGKYITGPWMSKFYQGANSDINHIEGIKIVRDVFTRLEGFLQDPGLIMSATHDFIGAELPKTPALEALQKEPVDKAFFWQRWRLV